MPIAGAISWTAIGIAGAILPLAGAVWALFIGIQTVRRLRVELN